VEASIKSTAASLGPMSSWVFEELSRRIITGELAPGSRVTEEFLASLLDASRTPLREALNHLVEIGLIVRQRNRTVRIAPLDVGDVNELSQIREHLEAIVAANAARQVREGRASLDKLRDIATQTEATLGSDHAASLNFELGNQFHAELTAISGVRHTAKIMAGVKLGLERYRYVNAANRERTPHRIVEHWRIFEAVASGDETEAEQRMREHIRSSLDSFAASLERILADTSVVNDT